MAKKSLKSIAKIMKDLDLCMFTTTTGRGMTASRPMSNNSDVDYKGESYFFTQKKSRLAKDIQKNANVSLSFAGTKMLKKIFVSVSGKAKLVLDKEAMRPHWNTDLEIWFKDGIESKDIAMVKVEAKHIKYWHGLEEGEIDR